MPATSEYVQTAADEISGNRSYWCMRQAKDALNWRTQVVNGKTVLTQITFREVTTEADGAFGEIKVTRYRVYRLDQMGNAQWQLWREIKNDRSEKVIIIESEGQILTKKGRALRRLPIAVHYGEHEGFLESRPPLKGIADINLACYQKYSDLSEHRTLHLRRDSCITGSRRAATQYEQWAGIASLPCR